MVKNFDEYFENRFTAQREWYSEKANWNKKWYLRLRVAVVIFAAAVPVTVSILPLSSPYTAPLLYILSFIVIASEAVLSTSNFQENWLNYRTTSEALKKERELFLTGTGPYTDTSGTDPEARFIERVEQLISRENRVWRITSEQEDEPPSMTSVQS